MSKKFLAIPIKFFELAQGVPPDDDAWEYIEAALEDAHRRMNEKKLADQA